MDVWGWEGGTMEGREEKRGGWDDAGEEREGKGVGRCWGERGRADETMWGRGGRGKRREGREPARHSKRHVSLPRQTGDKPEALNYIASGDQPVGASSTQH